MLKKMEHDISFPKPGESTSGIILGYHGKLKAALEASLDREDQSEKAASKAPPKSKPASA